ncbi:MAG: chemotaxis protein CheX [Verrucomicrobiota bacterium]
MIEQEIKPFIDVTVNYFRKITKNRIEVKPPVIEFGQSTLLDYTGIIELSGEVNGCIYITAPETMLQDLIEIVGDQTEDKNDENLSDLIGEVTNVISSNVRRDFGPKFKVSVPTVTRSGQSFPVEVPPLNLVLPIIWKSYECFLVIAFDESESATALQN